MLEFFKKKHLLVQLKSIMLKNHTIVLELIYLHLLLKLEERPIQRIQLLQVLQLVLGVIQIRMYLLLLQI